MVIVRFPNQFSGSSHALSENLEDRNIIIIIPTESLVLLIMRNIDIVSFSVYIGYWEIAHSNQKQTVFSATVSIYFSIHEF